MTNNKYGAKDFVTQLRGGIIDNNPTLVQLLGMCPTLATTTSALNGLGMGLAATAVLICSNMFISLLRKWIPKQVRIAAYIVIISGFVSAVELLIKAYLPSLDESLGVFIPLIVVNCIILARAEAFASKNPVLPSVVDGLAMGLGFTCSLFLLGSIREIIGAGTIFGITLFGGVYQPMLMFIMPPGAFITLGCIIAAVHKLMSNAAERARKRKVYAEFGGVSGEVDTAIDKIEGDGDPNAPEAEPESKDFDFVTDTAAESAAETPPADTGKTEPDGKAEPDSAKEESK